MVRSRGYVDAQYLLTAAVRLQALKERTYALMHAAPGQAVLDLGCGPGADTTALGRIVGPQGRVVGVDHDADMIALADGRAREARVAEWVHHHVADVTALPFAAATFDACRSERVFQHLREPERAFAELVRVTKPGGWMVVADVDYGTLSVDSSEVDLERRLVRFGADHGLHNGYAGRQLFRLFTQQHCTQISVMVVPSYSTSYAELRSLLPLETVAHDALARGAIAAEELHRLLVSLERAEAEGIFFCTVSTILVAGRARAQRPPAAPFD